MSAMPGPLSILTGVVFAHDMAAPMVMHRVDNAAPGSMTGMPRAWVNVIGAVLAGVLLCVGLTEANADADIPSLWPEPDLYPRAALRSRNL